VDWEKNKLATDSHRQKTNKTIKRKWETTEDTETTEKDLKKFLKSLYFF